MSDSSSFNHVFPVRFAHVKRCGIISIDWIYPLLFKIMNYHNYHAYIFPNIFKHILRFFSKYLIYEPNCYKLCNHHPYSYIYKNWNTLFCILKRNWSRPSRLFDKGQSVASNWIWQETTKKSTWKVWYEKIQKLWKRIWSWEALFGN